MPSITDQSTVEAIAREFTSNGRNKENAMKAVGYSDNYAEHRADMVLGNVGVKQAIARIDDVKQEKIEHDRTRSLKMLQKAYDVAENQGNSAAMTGAIREMDDISGLKATQPITIKNEIHHATAQTEAELLQKRLGLLNRMQSQASGIERN